VILEQILHGKQKVILKSAPIRQLTVM